jgi:hypothetical protein
MPLAQWLASEFAGLLQNNQARLKTPKLSRLTLDSCSPILPQHISAALQQWAMVLKEKWHVLWILNLDNPHTGGKDYTMK